MSSFNAADWSKSISRAALVIAMLVAVYQIHHLTATHQIRDEIYWPIAIAAAAYFAEAVSDEFRTANGESCGLLPKLWAQLTKSGYHRGVGEHHRSGYGRWRSSKFQWGGCCKPGC